MEKVRGVLVDLDGVLYDADRLIAGAIHTVRWLQTDGIPHLFVTNTTSKSRTALAEKLISHGIPASEGEVLTPAIAAAEWLRASEKGDIAVFVRPSARLDFQDLPCLPDSAERGAAYVVIGDLGDLWDFRTLNRAFRLLYHNPEATLIALGMTRYWLAPSGISLDVAPFVAALEHATGRKALVFGKPAAAFFRMATQKLGLPARILMVGDDIQADVRGAQKAGLQAALVKTGKFRPADLEGKIRPRVVLDSIADLPGWWTHNA
jgi:phospholysine phosphohistidine inorganic pyrophosphate phosphatase